MRKFTKIMAMLLAVLLLVGIMPPKAQAAGSTKLIALTFDDGPSSANTGRLLDGLKARGAHVSFFMTGENAKPFTMGGGTYARHAQPLAR